jgi:hypothetical protein
MVEMDGGDSSALGCLRTVVTHNCAHSSNLRAQKVEKWKGVSTRDCLIVNVRNELTHLYQKENSL